MTVTVPVLVTSEEHAALYQQAAVRGVPVDSLLREAVFQIVSEFFAIKPRHSSN